MKVVVDAFDPSLLVSNTNIHVMDFSTMAEEELYDVHIPLQFDLGRFRVVCAMHGVFCCRAAVYGTRIGMLV